MPHRGANHMAGTVCHALHAPLRHGLTLVLGCYWDIVVGYEFRIKTVPAIENLLEILAPALEKSEQIIDSCLLVAALQKLGVATESTVGTSWPQCCDLMIEETGEIYAIAHNSVGYQIIHRLAQHLKAKGYAVEVDDDI